MKLYRGFKTHAETLGAELRSELGLEPTDRFDPWACAEHLGIPVLTLSEFEARVGALDAISYFRDAAPERFSAVTVTHGYFRTIVHNDLHSRRRQASNIAHELSHAWLEHPANSDLSAQGCTRVDANLEAEADWLMGVLLMPRAGALHLARRGFNLSQLMCRFEISEDLCRWRLNVTGISRQLGTTVR